MNYSDITIISPVLLISVAALFMLVLECLLYKKPLTDQGAQLVERSKPLIGSWIILLAFLALSLQFVVPANTVNTEFLSSYIARVWVQDTFSLSASFLLIFSSLAIFTFSFSQLHKFSITKPRDTYALALFALSGGLILVSANDLLLSFIGIELLSIPTYVLCGSTLFAKLKKQEGYALDSEVKVSSEASLKYFILGAMSAAFLLYGISFLYGATGTTILSDIRYALGSANPNLASLGIGLLLAGVLFKVAAAPFHFWAPDVYQGAPLPVTAFMSLIVKIAAFVFLARFLWLGVPNQASLWQPMIWIVAILSMIVGNLLALRQASSLKRFYACSSIAQTGYLLLVFLSDIESGTGALTFYLVVYALTTLLFFAAVHAVVLAAGDEEAAVDSPDLLNGLAYSRPFLASCLSVALLSFAGLPPVIAGFMSKFVVFQAAFHAGFNGTVLFALLCATFSCAYYLGLVYRMFSEPKHKIEGKTPVSILLVLNIGLILITLMSIFPSSFISAIQKF